MKKYIRAISVVIIMVLFTLMAVASGSTGTSQTAEKVGEVEASGSADNQGTVQTTGTAENAEEKYICYVGDETVVDGVKYVFMESGEYHSDNEFSQAAEGNKIVYIKLYCENMSDSDKTVSYFDFETYADGYATEMYYSGDSNLSGTMSPGRSTTGCVYFEVPENAAEVEFEYEVNFLSEKKIKFVYEGEKNSGYVPAVNASASAETFKPGDILEAEDVRITYLSCSEYQSDNQFIQPAEGNRYIMFELEFENISDNDLFISSFDFDCYADGVSCENAYGRDDELSATISAGRKASGTVSFEVPIGASTIEMEYVTNIWTSDRIVFAFEEN